jgi:hypothetical protein
MSTATYVERRPHGNRSITDASALPTRAEGAERGNGGASGGELQSRTGAVDRPLAGKAAAAASTPTPPQPTIVPAYGASVEGVPSAVLHRFASECPGLLSTAAPLPPPWGPNETLHDEYLTRGEELFCTQGKQLFRDFRDDGNWTLPRGDAQLRSIQTASWYEDKATRLVLHPRVAVVTTALLSMYHMLNDFVLPWPYILEKIIQRRAPKTAKFPSPPGDTSWLTTLPMDYVVLHVDGSLRGTGSDNVSLMALSTLVPKGGEMRALIHKESSFDPTVHCYCRAMLQMPTYLVTYPKLATTMIADGDGERRRWTRHFQEAINVKFGFVPNGTYPVPEEEVSSLWTTPEALPAANGSVWMKPRLVVYLRSTTRLVWKIDEMVAAAKAVGFHVLVLHPEHHNLTVQARSARYADVVMAMHGAALTWISMVDTQGRFAHCREVIELCHYGRPFKRVHNVYELLAADNRLWYTRIAPTGALFDANVIPLKLQRHERRMLNKRSFPHDLPGFRHQTAVFDMPTVERALRSSFDRVSTCLREQRPISRSLLPKGEPVWKFS